MHEECSSDVAAPKMAAVSVASPAVVRFIVAVGSGTVCVVFYSRWQQLTQPAVKPHRLLTYSRWARIAACAQLPLVQVTR